MMRPLPRVHPASRLPGTMALIAILTLAGTTGPATARPRPDGPATLELAPDDSPPSFLISGLATGTAYDTSWYGGTVWAADSNRWEAIPNGAWTFDSGVGSAIQNEMPESAKPNGYHRLMEGWVGLGSDPHDNGAFHRSNTCVISGNFSMWLGRSVAEIEAEGSCWAAGQGYGNGWNAGLEQVFAYPGSGDVTLQFRYAVDSEAGFDAMTVVVRPSDAVGDIVLASYEGLVSGVATFTLRQSDGTLPAGPGTIAIRFVGTSDPSYSDEDGLSPTVCGLAAVDDVTLTGAIAHAAGFEFADDGWAATIPPVPVDDFSDLRDSGDLFTPSVSGYLCGCGLRDSVLVFIDPSHERADDSYGLVISPWIDLRAGGDANRPGHVIQLSLDSGPLSIAPSLVTGAQYYPYVCPSTGRIGVSPLSYSTTIFFYGSPSCGTRTFEISSRVPPGAEQVRIILGPITPFTGMNDPPPYIDNVRLGAYGPTNAPTLYTALQGLLQDNFASDGTLNPASPARLDVGRLISGSGPATLGDTLTVTAYGSNIEVRMVFRVRPGPFTHLISLAAAASRWTPEPALGSSWYSAQLDSAEGASGGGNSWMTMFHESDPGFIAPERAPDPGDPGHFLNDILPDNVFTPGSRLDYFLQARYRPPDPRNPGGNSWYIVPDTTGGNYFDVEVLPSSMSADSTWNCVLSVTTQLTEPRALRALEDDALNAVLGPGVVNAEGTRFDRYDAQYVWSTGLARRPGTAVGATAAQLNAYQVITWHSGSSSGSNQLDAPMLDSWLRTTDGVRRGFWGNGPAFAQSMHNGGATARNFLNLTLGTRYSCGAARSAGCPSGTGLDSTFCLPLVAAATPAFGLSGPASLYGNGCRNLISFPAITVEPGISEALGNLSYLKNGSPAPYASITIDQPSGLAYRTVVDAFPLYYLRRTPSDPHAPGQCANMTAMYERAFDVLGWLGTVGCPTVAISGLPPIEADPAPAVRPFLGEARPNPATGATRITFAVTRNGVPTRIDLFDVTGRLVRTLVDRSMDAGRHEVTWDGRAANGAEVGAGLYFYRMVSGSFVETRKLVVVK